MGGSDPGTSDPGTGDPGTGALALPAFVYRGSFGGTPYVLHVSLDEGAVGQLRNDQFVFDVTGNYGSEPVTATATFNLPGGNGTSQKVAFNGHVGSESIRGEATATMEGNGHVTITGTVNAVPTA